MSENKRTVQKYMEGFVAGDNERILSCLADDVVWNMPGHFQLSGKEAFDKEISNDNFTGTPDIQVSRMTEENDVVIAEGAVQCDFKAGGRIKALFCDVFVMDKGKIKQVTTYQVNL